MKYDHKKIEKKWQDHWIKNKTFKVDVDNSKPKYYVLDMFPFPSGAGLHVGHPEGYTATDIMSRHKRQKGFNVLHPMGWDSFGLPAEQYAVRTGTHPADTTKKNIDNFRRQLQALGFDYDWDREFATSDPRHYKWTQWIFTKLHERGLAYEADMQVNYCPALGTVLANEEVENGLSVVGGHPVERRMLRQWVLKITEYAERLIDDLKLVDWPEGLKKLQTNWIGKSIGATVHFAIKGFDDDLSVFTTRPDTLFGATYMVLAPEHPLVAKVTTSEQQEAVKKYQDKAANKSDLDRTELSKEKTGVFTGGFAINPVNNQEIPIWIADYVLMGYGTGAIMAVPAHDERDQEFAEEYNLPIIPVYDEELCINSANEEVSLDGLRFAEAKKKIISWLESKKFGEGATNYKLRDWLFSRQRYWGEPFPLLHLEDGTTRLLDIDELPLRLPDLEDFKPADDGRSPLAKVDNWVETTDPKTGQKARRETHTMPNWAGSCWYYLRFCDPHNDNEAWSQEAENYWLPVDLYVGGVEHAVLHLLYARFWHKVLFDCGLVSHPEPFKCLRNQGIITARSYKDKQGHYVATSDVKEKNGDYIHKETGEKLSSQVEKMSKSKLNGVTPDEIVEEFGADSLRLYEMFMGPLDKEKVWNTDAVSGCRRFLDRMWQIATSDKITDVDSEEALKLGHRAIHGVEKDIESMQFNTAIAKMMEFVNDFTKLDAYPRSVVKMVTQALSPFAPHLAEEMWEVLGSKEELTYHSYPKVDPKYLEDDTVTFVVQVNGKVRSRMTMNTDETEEVALANAKASPQIQKYLDGKEIRKVIFVPNKLLNIVV